MANTPYLDLESVTVEDNLKTTFLNKLNSNQEKIDAAYGTLSEALIETTGASNLASAVDMYTTLTSDLAVSEQARVIAEESYATLVAVSDGLTATAEDITLGKTAMVAGEVITGTRE